MEVEPLTIGLQVRCHTNIGVHNLEDMLVPIKVRRNMDVCVETLFSHIILGFRFRTCVVNSVCVIYFRE